MIIIIENNFFFLLKGKRLFLVILSRVDGRISDVFNENRSGFLPEVPTTRTRYTTRSSSVHRHKTRRKKKRTDIRGTERGTAVKENITITIFPAKRHWFSLVCHHSDPLTSRRALDTRWSAPQHGTRWIWPRARNCTAFERLYRRSWPGSTAKRSDIEKKPRLIF